jgi:hypothetical protein
MCAVSIRREKKRIWNEVKEKKLQEEKNGRKEK